MAVKILKPSEDALQEFVSEVEIITTLHHKNIVSLFGFCFENDSIILVYDFLSRGSLEEILHGEKENKCVLGWGKRYKVVVVVVEALDYLHCGDDSQPVIHRDVKSSNILISDDFEPQVGCNQWKLVWIMGSRETLMGLSCLQKDSSNFGRSYPISAFRRGSSFRGYTKIHQHMPWVFERGGEEMDFLQQQGIRVKVIPGITSASGIAAELGIPLTHRGVANSVRFLTGHSRNGGTDPLYVAEHAADPESTLVVYMGLSTLPALAQKLMNHGLPRETPAVAVERGTTLQQQTVFAQLKDLVNRVKLAELASPTLIIIGKVVELSPLWPQFSPETFLLKTEQLCPAETNA